MLWRVKKKNTKMTKDNAIGKRTKENMIIKGFVFTYPDDDESATLLRWWEKMYAGGPRVKYIE